MKVGKYRKKIAIEKTRQPRRAHRAGAAGNFAWAGYRKECRAVLAMSAITTIDSERKYETTNATNDMSM